MSNLFSHIEDPIESGNKIREYFNKIHEYFTEFNSNLLTILIVVCYPLENTLQKLFKYKMNNIKFIKIAVVTNYTLIYLSELCPNIEELEFNNLYIDDSTYLTIIKNCKKLKFKTIFGSNTFGINEILQILLENNKFETKFTLNFCKNITKETLWFLILKTKIIDLTIINNPSEIERIKDLWSFFSHLNYKLRIEFISFG